MRIRVLSAVLALGLSTLAFAATPPKVLVVAQVLDDLVSLDPAEGFELSSVQSFNSLYQRLVGSNPQKQTEIVGALASSWKAGTDGRSLTFTIKAGAVFASGNPVRPEDVIWSLSRAVKLNKSPVFILEELGWKAENVDSFLSKVSDTQVKVSWPAKVGPGFALSILSAPVASIVDSVLALSHEDSGDLGNGWLKTHSAGSGAFVIRTYTPHDSLILDANPKSPGGAPRLEGIVIKNVPDASARRLLVEQGDADIARDLGADQIDALKGKAGVAVQALPSAAVYYLAFNAANADNPALKNPALWEAARWAIDYNGIATKLLKGQYQVHQAFLPQGFPGALTENPYKLDIAKAKAALAKGGLKDVSVTLTVFNQPPYQDIAQNLQSTFAQAGITLNIESVVGSELYGKVRSRTHQAAFLFWIPDYFDANSNASTFAINRDDGTKTVAWRNGWVIPALSDKTQAAVEAQDQGTRNKLYGEIQKEVRDTSPLIVAFQGTDQVVLRSNVKGYVQGLNADQVFFEKVTK